ncbi:MAG: hypothetical protein ACE5NC_09820 [Anaerolineae bacterium]
MRQTLQLFAAWGHAATVEQLARHLVGGAAEPEALRRILQDSDGLTVQDGFVALRDGGVLIAKTRRRMAAHADLQAVYLSLAREYSTQLLQWCPFLQCIALTGSLASGGFQEGDDVDFDLFVESGTKYTTYLIGTLLGVRYAWRFRHRETDPRHATPLLPKVTCVNVVWREHETRPFLRTDENMAYELLRCRPLFGAPRFLEVLQDNAWLQDHFPQIYAQTWSDEVTDGQLNPVGRFLRSLSTWPRLLRAVEVLSRGLAWSLYRVVQWSRRNNPEALAHIEFLHQVKHPYEVFQD